MSNDREIRVRVKVAADANAAHEALETLTGPAIAPNRAKSGKTNGSLIEAVQALAGTLESAAAEFRRGLDALPANGASAGTWETPARPGEPASGGGPAAAAGPERGRDEMEPGGDAIASRPPNPAPDGMPGVYPPGDSSGAPGANDFRPPAGAGTGFADAQPGNFDHFAAGRARVANGNAAADWLGAYETRAGETAQRTQELLERILRLMEISPAILDRLTALEQRVKNQTMNDHALGSSGS